MITADTLDSLRATYFHGADFAISDFGIQACDPLTGELLTPNAIPPCLVDTPQESGFQYLRQRGRRQDLTVQLVLGAHGDAQDFANTQAKHQSVLEAADIVGIEASWRRRGSGEIVNPYTIEPALAAQVGRQAFQQAQISWLRDRNKLVLPCQVEDGLETGLMQSLDRLWGVYEQATCSPQLFDFPIERNAVRSIATVLYQTVRHWTIVGQFGEHLRLLDREGALPGGHLHVPLMLGELHAPNMRRFNRLGVQCERYTTEKVDTFGTIFMAMVQQAGATYDQLAVPVPEEDE